jgi:hypothetical protein
MVSGIYSLTFKSSLGYFGEGWALVDNGRVYGGDERYLYRGCYIDEEGSLKAEIQVSLYRNQRPVSVFGFLSEFQLELLGSSKEDQFILSGKVVKQPILSITIEGKKIADLIP